jgi:hypothetical protein
MRTSYSRSAKPLKGSSKYDLSRILSLLYCQFDTLIERPVKLNASPVVVREPGIGEFGGDLVIRLWKRVLRRKG